MGLLKERIEPLKSQQELMHADTKVTYLFLGQQAVSTKYSSILLESNATVSIKVPCRQYIVPAIVRF
ncbi:hypothetical protein Tco_1103675 [Tanacetum coccineum]